MGELGGSSRGGMAWKLLAAEGVARSIALVGVALQLVSFMIKIGLELTWRPAAMLVELGACVAIVFAAFRWRRCWPLVLLAVWQVSIAGMIWIASLEYWTGDCLPNYKCSGFEGPTGWEKTASFAVAVGALLLIASASALWQIRAAEVRPPEPPREPFT